ncbi:hypothetical protein [Ferruginibacter sp.]
MKSVIIFCLFIMIMVIAQFANAQTVDDVIEKNIAAMGGKDKLATLNSVRMEGNLSVQGTDVNIVITKLHNVGMRNDISVMSTENYQIATPTGGTVFMPVFGQASPQPMPDDQLKSAQTALDLHGTFVNYKEKGTQLELLGKEAVDGVDCYKVKATFKNGNVTVYFYDAKTNLLLKTSTEGSANGEKVDVYTIYSNYKQNADGYWFAYTTTNSRGQTDFDKIETNIKVDEKIFK